MAGKSQTIHMQDIEGNIQGKKKDRLTSSPDLFTDVYTQIITYNKHIGHKGILNHITGNNSIECMNKYQQLCVWK